MKNRLHFYLLGLTPLLLALLVWDLEFSDIAPNASSGELNQPAPDAIVENPKLLQYNLYGRLEQQIQGTQLLSFNNENRLLVTHPKFVFTEESGALWNISANEGSFLEANNTFNLEGDVEMNRQSTRLPLSLSTSSLELDLDGQRLQTSSPVIIEAPGHQITSEGFRADLSSSQFELLKNVVARHDSI